MILLTKFGCVVRIGKENFDRFLLILYHVISYSKTFEWMANLT